jgi:hypothetical protein
MPRTPPKTKNVQTVETMLEIVIDRVSGLRDQVAELDKKMDVHTLQNQYEFDSIKKLDQEQNAILQEHHDRSVQLKRDNDLREQALRLELEKTNERIEKLEIPGQAWSYVIKLIKWAGIVATSLTAIYAVYTQLK